MASIHDTPSWVFTAGEKVQYGYKTVVICGMTYYDGIPYYILCHPDTGNIYTDIHWTQLARSEQ